MDPIIQQIFDPSSSLLGRIIAVLTLAAIATFVYMARSSMHASDNKEREDREADRRAEAIVRQVRREMAEETATKASREPEAR